MARLVERDAVAGLGLPLEIGAARLAGLDLGPATSVAPFRGREAEVAGTLGAWPGPGEVVAVGEGRLVWWGLGRALLAGVAAPEGLGEMAAVVAQGDGIAAVRLEGGAARDVLARLVPLDLREGAFPEGATVRTLLNHLTVTLIRSGDGFEILAMRSVAATLVRELDHAMRGVAARAAVQGT